jgi:hypothetical protein
MPTGVLAMSDATQAQNWLTGANVAAEEALRRSRASWFPLTVFGLLILGALPFFVFPWRADRAWDVLIDVPYPGPWAARYWLIALPAGYLATAAYFRWRAGRAGVARRYLPFVVAGLALLVLLVVSQTKGIVLHPNLWIRGLGPLLTVALGLLILAIADRSRALAAIVVVFLAITVLVSLYDVINILYRLGWSISPRFHDWPNLILPGLFLLVSGLVLLRKQRLP